MNRNDLIGSPELIRARRAAVDLRNLIAVHYALETRSLREERPLGEELKCIRSSPLATIQLPTRRR